MAGSFLQDIKYALRTARLNPWSTFAAFLMLTLGIGASTAVFSVADALMIRALPVKDPDKLVKIFESDPAMPRQDLSMQDYVDWKPELKSFAGMGLYGWREMNLTGSGEPLRVEIYRAEWSVLPVLGIAPAWGRNFRPEENRPGHNQVALLSWALWQSHFGGQNVIGRKILLDGAPYTIVGILPKNLFVLGNTSLWIPLTFDFAELLNTRGYHWYGAVGRLRKGASLAQANAELAVAAARTAREYPKQNGQETALAVPLSQWITHKARPALMMLLGAVGCVLLIALGNVANLLLVRASARQREMSVRIAMGATRARLISQLLVESVLLSFTAALAGTALAAVAIRVVKSAGLDEIEYPEGITLNWQVLLFAIGTGVLAGIIFGFAPAVRAWAMRVNDALKQASGRLTDLKGQQRVRQLFVFLQTALAALLLIDAGLLIQSFEKASAIDPGFRPDHLITMQVSLYPARYGSPGAIGRFAAALLERIRPLPGIESAAITTNLPLDGGGGGPVITEGSTADRLQDSRIAQYTRVSPDYFKTVGVRLLSGRDFNERDGATTTPVAIVNEQFVREFLSGQNPIGRRVMDITPHPVWKQIVGVVADVRQRNLETSVAPELFVPLAQEAEGSLAIVARTSGDPRKLAKPIEAQLHKLDPDLPVYSIETMEDLMAQKRGWRTFHTSLLTGFAAVAMILAAIGIYAVVAYSTAQRVSEIGVRMAVGASQHDILRMILRQGISPALLGSIAGIGLSFGATGLIVNLLYGVTAINWPTYLSVVLLLVTVAAAGSYLPARRAAAIDAWQALRDE